MKRIEMVFLGSIVCLTLFIGLAIGQDNKGSKPESDLAEGPQIGQPAPDFELPWADQTAIHTAKNEWIKLSGQRGANVILAFYVADWTGG